jgi:hypothetical protein
MYQLNNTEYFFDTVKRTYEATKPVLSKDCSVEDDVRPIGQRRYKWERIAKVDDNTYVLLDGYWTGSTYARTNVVTAMAPITVQRREDGDYIRVRNGTVGSAWTSRYKFLMHHLPRGMQFIGRFKEGSHTIYLSQTNKAYPLPKSTFQYDFQTCVIEKDGDEALWFKQTDINVFERAGHELEVRTSRLDKDLKKQLKPKIKEFFDWMCIMAPMLQNDWQAKKMYLDELQCDAWRVVAGRLDSKLVRDIVTNPEHENRVALAAVLSIELSIDLVKDEADLATLRTRYNDFMNKALGLYKTEMI